MVQTSITPQLRIPESLRALPQWVVARSDKRPINARMGSPASVTNPATWSDFDTALTASRANDCDVGFVLTKEAGFTIIDLDDKLEKPLDDKQRKRQIAILDHFDSYTERSVSGRGYHIILKGAIPSGVRRDNVEIYSDARYMICTGDVVKDLPVSDQFQSSLEDMYGQMLADDQMVVANTQPLPRLADQEVLDKARESYGRRFEALSNGGWQSLCIGDGSQSAADLELAGKLAEFTSDDHQVKRLFLASALGKRDKAIKRKDYLDKFTIPKARCIGDTQRSLLEHGRSVAQVLLASLQAPKSASVTSLLEPFSTFIYKKVSVLKLVRGVLGEGGLSVLYGLPGAGKSFLALDLALAVATGQPWMDRVTRPGPVIYAAGEGVSGLRMRGQAIAKIKCFDQPRVFFLPHALSTPDEGEKLAALLDQVQTTCNAPPVLLIFDTLSRFFGEGDDENSAKDMKRFVGAVSALIAKCPTLHVMIVHHSGKDPVKGMRGSSSLQGAADTVIQVRKDRDRHIAFIEKQKDGQDQTFLPFALQQVELGQDEDGEPITSCVVVPCNEGMQSPLTGWIATAVKLLRHLKESVLADGGGGNLATKISMTEYHDQWYEERRNDKKDTVRKNANRQLEALRDKRLLDWDGGAAPIRLLPNFASVTIEEDIGS
jgi:hypothetical protein